MKKLPVTWCSNRTSWMNSYIFTNWLNEFDEIIEKQNRKILLFLDNAPAHSPDIKLKNITLKFFPSNTTARIQPLDQGAIKTFKANYRRQLVQHIIANANTAYSADDVAITALDAVFWIECAWKSVTETILRNTFKEAAFNNEDVVPKNTCFDELNSVLKHLTIGGDIMSATDFVSIDDDVPAFNEWDDGNEKILAIDGISNEDTGQDEGTIV
ncbi:unnamed protein product [Rotaria sp. Silwood2]|nr:unnamed protein product [Rotaria sp. Silwood2]